MKYSLVVCIPLLVSVLAFAAIARTINRQGIVKAKGEPFTGSGQFRFRFIDLTAKGSWTNNGAHLGEARGTTALGYAVNTIWSETATTMSEGSIYPFTNSPIDNR